MGNLENLKRCLGQPLVRKLKDKDGNDVEFEFKPLTVDSLPEFMTLAGELSGDEKAIFKKENTEILTKLLMDMLRRSFEGADEEELKEFAMTNILELQKILVDVNKQLTPEVPEKVKKMRNASK